MAKAKDIIERSIEMHPTLFCEALNGQAMDHLKYANGTTTSVRSIQGAIASLKACERASDWVGRDDLPAGERASCICAECGTMVVALNVACKLQLIPAHVRTAAAVDWEENNKS